MTRKSGISISIALLAFAALACTCARSLPSVSSAAQVTPVATVPVSQGAADSMDKKLGQAVQQYQSTGQFQATFNESEITSYLVREIQAAQSRGETVPLTNPQVKLLPGQVSVYGTYHVGSSGMAGVLVVSPQVQNGRLITKIVSANMGPVPVPSAALDQLQQQLQAATDRLMARDPNVTLTNVTVRQGALDVAGTRK